MKNRIFLEDMALGIYDRPGPKDNIGRPDEEITVPDELPLQPSEQMSNQLSVDRPPIEDDQFTPGSIEELSRAATAIAKLVPSSQIEFFYRSLHTLLDQSTDRDGTPKDADMSSEKVDSPRPVKVSQEPPAKNLNTESMIRKSIKRRLAEVLSTSDDDVEELDSYRGRKADPKGIDYFGELDPVQSAEPVSQQGGVSLDDIADEMGYSGASGVRQEIQRLLGRLQYFVVNVQPEDLEALKDFAVGEYIDSLGNYDSGLSDEDINDLKSNPSEVKFLKSFKYFFVMHFIMPAYRKVVREATRRLNSAIDNLGVPADLKQTIFNQITGLSKRGTIAKKLASKVKSKDITKEQAIELVQKIEPEMVSLQRTSEKTSDLIQTSLDKWNSLGKKRKAAAVEKSLRASIES